MIDNKTHGNTVADLSLLYELSLSIGSSLDLTTNCSVFLKTLLARKNLAFASVWIKNRYLPGQESGTGASLVYAHPDYRVKETHLSLNHSIFRSLRKKKSLSLTSSDPGYQKIGGEKGIRRGTFALFALGDIGVLKIFSSIRKERFGKKELLQLEKVISKFSVSLEGCLSYQNSTREISERRQAEEALRESEKRFKEIAENAQEWIWEMDADGVYTYASPMVKNILGFKPEEIVGRKHYYDFFHPDDKIRLKKEASAVFARKQPFREFPNRNAHKNGRTVWLSTSGVPLTDADGDLIGYRGADTDITLRKQREEQLRFQSSIAEQSTEGIAIVDLEGKLVFVNRAFAAMHGFQAKKLLGKHLSVFHTSDQIPAVKAANKRLRETGEFNGEIQHTRSDGTKFPAMMHNSLLRDENGTPIGMIGTCRDITERKQAQAALLTSEARYRSLFEDSPLSLWEEDFSEVKIYLDGLWKKKPANFRQYFDKNPEVVAECAKKVKIVDVNQATLNMYKAKNLGNFRRGLSKVFTGESFEAYKEELITLAEGKTRFETETISRTMEGEEKYIRITISTPPDYEKTWSKILISIVDISERKLAEEELRASEEKYRIFVERASDGILIIQDGIVKYANPRLGEMSGYSVDKLIDSPFTDYVHPDEISKMVEHYRRRIAGKDVESVYETVLKRGDGIDINAEVNAGIIMYQGVPADLVFIRDITERKKMAEEHIKSSKLESLGIMAGGIAHDFNNILTGILGNISLARMELEPEGKAVDRLRAAEKATMRAKNLTQQLLTFSKGGGAG